VETFRKPEAGQIVKGRAKPVPFVFTNYTLANAGQIRDVPLADSYLLSPANLNKAEISPKFLEAEVGIGVCT
jgi:hypothetical protein